MAPVHLPNFATLDLLPSWCNLRGGIDRSACIEVRVSEVRRLAGCIWIDPSGARDERGRPRRLTLKLPNEQSTRTAARGEAHGQRLASGIYTISAHELHDLHQSRMPRTLAGDFRTARANVMREVVSEHWPMVSDRNGRGQKSAGSDVRSQAARSAQHSAPSPWGTQHSRGFRTRITRANPFAFPLDRGLPGNPNKGATRTKRIGLPLDWTQPLRIEKWIYPRRIRPAYFLICPGTSHVNHRDHREHRGEKNSKPNPSSVSSVCSVVNCPPLCPGTSHVNHRNHREHRGEKNSKPNPSSVSSVCSVVNCPPPLSTRPPGRLDPHTSGGTCPQRVLKLMMVQATEAEIRDAELAELWIDSLPRGPGGLHLREPFRGHIARLIDRYGPIMLPRVLLCPRCLGAKYGNNPETVRQGWRRRNGLPDTSVRGKAHHGDAENAEKNEVNESLMTSSQSPNHQIAKSPDPPGPQSPNRHFRGIAKSPNPPDLVTRNLHRLIVPLNHFTRSTYESQRARITGVPPGPGMHDMDPDEYAQQQKERRSQRARAKARERGRRYRQRHAPRTLEDEHILIRAAQSGSPRAMEDVMAMFKRKEKHNARLAKKVEAARRDFEQFKQRQAKGHRA